MEQVPAQQRDKLDDEPWTAVFVLRRLEPWSSPEETVAEETVAELRSRFDAAGFLVATPPDTVMVSVDGADERAWRHFFEIFDDYPGLMWTAVSIPTRIELTDVREAFQRVVIRSAGFTVDDTDVGLACATKEAHS